jgi:hypothetical protein
MRGRGLVAAGVIVCVGVATACTDGTTPDCSDAQCLPVIVVDAASLGDAQGDVTVAEGGGSGRGPDGTTDGARDAGPAPSDGSVDSGDSSSPDMRDAGGGD